MSPRPQDIQAAKLFRLLARAQIVRRELAKVAATDRAKPERPGFQKQINHLRKKLS